MNDAFFLGFDDSMLTSDAVQQRRKLFEFFRYVLARVRAFRSYLHDELKMTIIIIFKWFSTKVNARSISLIYYGFFFAEFMAKIKYKRTHRNQVKELFAQQTRWVHPSSK